MSSQEEANVMIIPEESSPQRVKLVAKRSPSTKVIPAAAAGSSNAAPTDQVHLVESSSSLRDSNKKKERSPKRPGESPVDRNRRKTKERMALKRLNPIFRAEENKATKNRYHDDEGFRSKQLERKKTRYHNDEGFRTQQLERHNEQQKARYRESEEFRNYQKAKRKEQWERKKLAGLTDACKKLDFTPDSALLKWLGQSEFLKDEKLGIDFEDYLQRLPLTKLLDKFPQFVSEEFLRNKDYCVYVDTLFDWPELQGKSIPEAEKIISQTSSDKQKKMFTYIGLHSNGQKSRPGHRHDPNSAIFQFLQTPGTRAFNSFLFNCNPLGMKTASGDKLRAMIAQAEVRMRELEALLITFQGKRQKLPFDGMQQMSINKKIEPLRTELKKQASDLCKTAQLFDFSKSGRKATPKAGCLSGADLPFFIINEIKI